MSTLGGMRGRSGGMTSVFGFSQLLFVASVPPAAPLDRSGRGNDGLSRVPLDRVAVERWIERMGAVPGWARCLGECRRPLRRTGDLCATQHRSPATRVQGGCPGGRARGHPRPAGGPAVESWVWKVAGCAPARLGARCPLTLGGLRSRTVGAERSVGGAGGRSRTEGALDGAVSVASKESPAASGILLFSHTSRGRGAGKRSLLGLLATRRLNQEASEYLLRCCFDLSAVVDRFGEPFEPSMVRASSSRRSRFEGRVFVARRKVVRSARDGVGVVRGGKFSNT